MKPAAFVLLLDLLGAFAFALNGAMTAAKMVRLDIVGVVVLGVVTATGGGIIRDVLLGAAPPIAFTAWYYLAAAVCFAIRMAGLKFRLNAPVSRAHREESS